MTIYAEWTIDGELYVDWFHSWDEYHAATFSPDGDIKKVQILRPYKRRRR